MILCEQLSLCGADLSERASDFRDLSQFRADFVADFISKTLRDDHGSLLTCWRFEGSELSQGAEVEFETW